MFFFIKKKSQKIYLLYTHKNIEIFVLLAFFLNLILNKKHSLYIMIFLCCQEMPRSKNLFIFNIFISL